MWFIRLIIILISKAYTLDISSFNINFIKKEKKLYYVNAMNNDNGDIYFEFWGETNKIRYFIAIDYLNEERLKLNGNEIYSIETYANSKYHDSIIVKYNNDINIFSMNYDYFSFIDIKNSKYTSKNTKDIIFEDNGKSSQRNSILKLKDNTFLLSILLLKGGLLVDSSYINFRIFKFNSNNINGYVELASWEKNINRLNSTSCIQTESQYIQCIIPVMTFIADKADLQIGIFDTKLNQKNTITYSNVKDNSFTKLFHIKDEIAGYIYFEYNFNIPTLLLKKLNKNTFRLDNVINNKDNIIEYIGCDMNIVIFKKYCKYF